MTGITGCIPVEENRRNTEDEQEHAMKTKQPLWLEVLRWIFLIPGVMLMAFIADVILQFLFEIDIRTNPSMGPIGYFWKSFVLGAVYGAVLPFSGTCIAPRGRKAVSVIICLAYLAGTSVFILPLEHMWLYWAGTNLGAIGITVGLWGEMSDQQKPFE